MDPWDPLGSLTNRRASRRSASGKDHEHGCRFRAASRRGFGISGTWHIPWLRIQDATHTELLLSLNDGGDVDNTEGDSDAECEELAGGGKRRKHLKPKIWSALLRFSECWQHQWSPPRSGAYSTFNDGASLVDAAAAESVAPAPPFVPSSRTERRAFPALGGASDDEPFHSAAFQSGASHAVASEATEEQEQRSDTTDVSLPKKLTDALVGAVAPWAPLVWTRRPKRLFEHVTQETLQKASAASDAIRQKAVDVAYGRACLLAAAEATMFDADFAHGEELSLDLENDSTEMFWLAPSTRCNYVSLSVEAGAFFANTNQSILDDYSDLRQRLEYGFRGSAESFASARRRVEQMTQDTFQAATAAASDAFRRMETICARPRSRSDGCMSGSAADCVTSEDILFTSLLGSESETAAAAAAVPEQEALKCYMLFSSPLCLERLVIVRLALERSSFTTAAEELASWGLALELSTVRAVYPGGRIANWNAQCRHVEEMVKPGDELIHFTVPNMKPPEGFAGNMHRPWPVLEERVASAVGSGNSSSTYIELVFRALRALPPLRIREEITALGRSGCAVVPCAATVHNIRALIAAADCRIIHMSLHCAADQDQGNVLLLEDGSGKAHMIRSVDFQKLLNRGQEKQHIDIVFLNACQSYTIGMDLIDCGVRHVVCVRDDIKVQDASCCLFARDFFGALGAGRSVQESFDSGMALLEYSDDKRLQKDAYAFVLLPVDGDHSKVYCKGHASHGRIKPLDCGSWGQLPPPVEDFVGREVDIHRLVQCLRTRRFLKLMGEPGIGKSSLLAEAGRFLSLRVGEPFEEVRWICGDDDTLRQACIEGMRDLRERLVIVPKRRVLLLVNDHTALAWASLRQLLRFEGVSVVVAMRPFAHEAEDAVAAVAVAAGLKPVCVQVTPLDPVAQAMLFMRRASRPLYTSDLGHPQNPARGARVDMLLPVMSPSGYMALADAPRLRAQCGNPRAIIVAAQDLGASSELPPYALGSGARGAELAESSDTSDADVGSCCSVCSTPRIARKAFRRVRLVRLSDGKSRDEWLRCDMRISEVLEEHTPQALQGAAEVVIMGCRAHINASLYDFPDDEQLGLLVLGLRAADKDSW